MKLLHRIISYVFFPGTMALLGFGTLILQLDRAHLLSVGFFMPRYYGLVVVASYFVFPLLMLYALIWLRVLPDIHLYDRKKRNISYPIALAGAAFCWWWMGQAAWPVNSALSFYSVAWSLAILMVLAVIWLVNAVWLKASAHAAGTAGFAALQLWTWRGVQDVPFVLAGLIILTLVYLARRGLSAHSHKELIIGLSLGFIVTFAILYLETYSAILWN